MKNFNLIFSRLKKEDSHLVNISFRKMSVYTKLLIGGCHNFSNNIQSLLKYFLNKSMLFNRTTKERNRKLAK